MIGIIRTAVSTNLSTQTFIILLPTLSELILCIAPTNPVSNRCSHNTIFWHSKPKVSVLREIFWYRVRVDHQKTIAIQIMPDRLILPDYSWDMLIRASNPAFSCGRSPVSLEPLSIRLNRLTNGEIEPIINHFPARGGVTRRQVDFPVRNSHRFGPFHGPDFSSVHYPGAQDTRASLCHNPFQSVAP